MKLKAQVGGLVFLGLVFVAGAAGARTDDLERVTARAGILVDRSTGNLIWERRSDVALPPASTTKVLTALVALRSGRLNDAVGVSTAAAKAPPSKVYLGAGWQMTIADLLYAIMLNSANDAAEVIAEGIGGSIENFAARMNREARRIGALDSHFVNPHGLPAENHVSTARDLVTIFNEAMHEPTFLHVVGTKNTVIRPAAKGTRRIQLRNRNRLLYDSELRVIGKTGWTRAAKKCFVGAVFADDGRQLLVSILGSNDLWGDLRRIIRHGLAQQPEIAPEVQVGELMAPLGGIPIEGAVLGEGDAPPARPSDLVAANDAPTFSLQLASFRSVHRAERLRRSVAGAGYPVLVRRVDRSRRTLYQVRVRDFSSRREAERASSQIRRKHRDLRPIVVAHDG